MTVTGRYTARSWTQWTQGFQYGNALLCFEMTGKRDLLTHGAAARRRRHGRASHPHWCSRPWLQQHLHLRPPAPPDARRPHSHQQLGVAFYELALKVSGAVQAARWTASRMVSVTSTLSMAATLCSSIRSAPCASAALPTCWATPCSRTRPARRFAGKGADPRKNLGPVQHLLRRRTRSLRHAGAARPHRARSHLQSGKWRLPLPVSQQGYSPFTTWTRGLAWAMLGFPELMEFLQSVDGPADKQRRWLCWRKQRAPAAISISIRRAHLTASAIGIPERRSWIGWAIGRRNRPTLTMIMSRSMLRPAPLARKDCFASGIYWAQPARLHPGRPHRCQRAAAGTLPRSRPSS